MVHQSIDDRRGQRVIDVEDLAPFAEFAIGRNDDRSGFITGSNDLEHEVRTAFVDGKISQLIEKEKFRSDILAEFFLQRSIQLCGGQHVDHVDHPRVPDLDSLLTSDVTEGRQQMRFSRAGPAHQNGAAVLGLLLALLSLVLAHITGQQHQVRLPVANGRQQRRQVAVGLVAADDIEDHVDPTRHGRLERRRPVGG